LATYTTQHHILIATYHVSVEEGSVGSKCQWSLCQLNFAMAVLHKNYTHGYDIIYEL